MSCAPSITLITMKCKYLLLLCTLTAACATTKPMTLTYDTPTDPTLQAHLMRIDTELRTKYEMTEEQTMAGVLDLTRNRLAMLRPDRIEYAASVAKLGILLAYFDKHRDAATSLDPTVRHELGLMAKASSNEMAAKYSREMGLREIQEVLNRYGFYDAAKGGGIWVGKHYGPNSERIGDPVANHSHAVTVRQLLRFYLLLEQGKLVTPEASATMKEILASPDIPHDDIKFVKALAGPEVTILRKWGSWETWNHDTALITAPGRRYILVALTNHARGDEYLVDFAKSVDGVMRAR
jgi:beta-lactamase class A